MLSYETNAIPSTSLYWLLRLRWLAAAAVVTISALAYALFSLQLPWGILLSVVALLITSNLVILLRPPTSPRSLVHCIGGLILTDVLLLTWLLYFTGGAHNPFTVLYVLHITLAVMLLNVRWACFFVLLCCSGFALLFTSDHMLLGADGIAVCSDLDFHLQGMLAATLVTGAGVVYFVARLNRDLRSSRVAMEKAQQIADRERRFSGLVTVAAGVSHELATPLGTIAVASHELEIAAAKGQWDPSMTADIRLIRAEVERCSHILGQLSRDAFSPDSTPQRRIPAQQLPAELEPLLPPHCNQRIVWQIQPNARTSLLPSSPLLRVLAILIKNACEASTESSAVTIRLQTDATRCQLQISDDGHGMTAEQLQRLGEPFFTTKAQGQGIGLGYFLAKSMLERAGGHITAQSTPGQGTLIDLTIPIANEVLAE